MYENVKSRVRCSNGYTDYIDCKIGRKQGCLISPQLFTFFINEWVQDLFNNGVRGIQISPNDAEILLLMFADDVALLADTVLGLQRQLDSLQQFCTRTGLHVNPQKTKIMVFRKGGKPVMNKRWSYAGTLIDVVQSFTYMYIGVCFFPSLSLSKMASENAIKGKRALNGILSSLYKYGQLSNSVFFKLFDSKISSVLLHGSEIWVFKEIQCIKSVYRHACKRYLCVGEKT